MRLSCTPCAEQPATENLDDWKERTFSGWLFRWDDDYEVAVWSWPERRQVFRDGRWHDLPQTWHTPEYEVIPDLSGYDWVSCSDERPYFDFPRGWDIPGHPDPEVKGPDIYGLHRED